MFIALVIASVLIAAMCASSASLKLRKDERSVAVISGTVGVPLRFGDVRRGDQHVQDHAGFSPVDHVVGVVAHP